MSEQTAQPEAPQKPQIRESAKDVVNTFLKEKKITLGTKQPKIEITQSGAILIQSPEIVAYYNDEVK